MSLQGRDDERLWWSAPVKPALDEADVAILAELFRDPRAPYASVGARVGLTANAVKARVRRLEGNGVLQGFAAAPAPEVLGMTECLLVFTDVPDLPEREDDVLRSLPDAPGVRYVDVTADGAVLVWAYARDDADIERLERVAVSVVGKPPLRAERTAPRAPATPATASDWRLLRALAPDARRPLRELASASGLSLKTVKRRLSALVESGRVRLEPVLSTSDAAGLVLFTLHVTLRPGATPRDVLALLPPTSIAEPRDAWLNVHVARRTMREALGDLAALRRSPHVERAMMAIATRRRADGWLDEAIAQRLVATTPEAAAPPVPVPRTR